MVGQNDERKEYIGRKEKACVARKFLRYVAKD